MAVHGHTPFVTVFGTPPKHSAHCSLLEPLLCSLAPDERSSSGDGPSPQTQAQGTSTSGPGPRLSLRPLRLRRPSRDSGTFVVPIVTNPMYNPRGEASGLQAGPK